MVTAAHCLYDDDDEPFTVSDVSVLLGLHDNLLTAEAGR